MENSGHSNLLDIHLYIWDVLHVFISRSPLGLSFVNLSADTHRPKPDTARCWLPLAAQKEPSSPGARTLPLILPSMWTLLWGHLFAGSQAHNSMQITLVIHDLHALGFRQVGSFAECVRPKASMANYELTDCEMVWMLRLWGTEGA